MIEDIITRAREQGRLIATIVAIFVWATPVVISIYAVHVAKQGNGFTKLQAIEISDTVIYYYSAVNGYGDHDGDVVTSS